MILNCPACRARYVVPDGAIGPQGRNVRCAQCRHSWFQDGEEVAPPLTVKRAPPRPPATPARDEAAPPPAPPPSHPLRRSAAPASETQAEPQRRPAARPRPEARPEPRPEPEPVRQPEPIDWAPTEPEPQAERRPARRNPARLWTIAAVVAALLMVSALAAIYTIGTQQIAAWLGSGEAPAGEQLRFTRRDVTREPLPTDKELLTVTGEITNLTDEVQRLPQIRAEVTDAEQRVIFQWMIAPPVRELQPRQAVTFSSVSTDVPKGGRNLKLSFGPTS